MSRTFIDTNVLVYAATDDDPRKRDVARKLLRELAESGQGVVSTQVVQELFAVLVRKRGVPASEARRLGLLAMGYVVQDVTAEVVRRGMDLAVLESLSVWDALIIAAAEAAGCRDVASEDMGNGQRYGDVVVRSPFAANS